MPIIIRLKYCFYIFKVHLVSVNLLHKTKKKHLPKSITFKKNLKLRTNKIHISGKRYYLDKISIHRYKSYNKYLKNMNIIQNLTCNITHLGKRLVTDLNSTYTAIGKLRKRWYAIVSLILHSTWNALVVLIIHSLYWFSKLIISFVLKNFILYLINIWREISIFVWRFTRGKLKVILMKRFAFTYASCFISIF